MKLCLERIVLFFIIESSLLSYHACIKFSLPSVRSSVGSSNMFERLKNSIYTNLFPKRTNVVSNSVDVNLIKKLGLSSLSILLGYGLLHQEHNRKISPFDPQTIIVNGPFFQVRLLFNRFQRPEYV